MILTEDEVGFPLQVCEGWGGYHYDQEVGEPV